MDKEQFDDFKNYLIGKIQSLEFSPGVVVAVDESFGTDDVVRLGSHNRYPYYTGDYTISIRYSNPQIGAKNHMRAIGADKSYGS